MLCPKVTALHTPSHVNIEVQREPMPSRAWARGHHDEKQPLATIAALCRGNLREENTLLQAAAVNDKAAKTFLRPLWARSHVVWERDRGYIFTPSCCLVT